MPKRAKSALVSLIGAVILFSPGMAGAWAPGIYSHPLPREHSSAECMRRAHVIARANPRMTLVTGSTSLLLQSDAEDVSYNIRCDLEGWAMFIVAGSRADLVEHMTRLHRAYRNA